MKEQTVSFIVGMSPNGTAFSIGGGGAVGAQFVSAEVLEETIVEGGGKVMKIKILQTGEEVNIAMPGK